MFDAMLKNAGTLPTTHYSLSLFTVSTLSGIRAIDTAALAGVIFKIKHFTPFDHSAPGKLKPTSSRRTLPLNPTGDSRPQAPWLYPPKYVIGIGGYKPLRDIGDGA